MKRKGKIPTTQADDLLGCPFCGTPVRLKHTVSYSNWNHKGEGGTYFDPITARPTEEIRCPNVHCAVRPWVSRIETGDAVQLWNTRL